MYNRDMNKILGYGLAIVVILVGGYYAFTYYSGLYSDDLGCAQVITDARDPVTGEVRTFPTPCNVPDGWEVLETDEVQIMRNGETWERYRNDDLGLRFEYRSEPDGYMVIERDEQNDTAGYENVVKYIVVSNKREYEEMMASESPREGPTAITITIVKNTENLSVGEWIQAEPRLSNIDLAMTPIMDVDHEAVPSVRYTINGLYSADVIVSSNNGRIYMFSGAYGSEDSAIRLDFLEMLDYVSLY